MSNFPGLWICIDGPDFTGKGTQATELIRRLIKDNEDNVITYTHEPTRDARKIKEKLRAERGDAYKDPRIMAELYIDDRAKNRGDVIQPTLRAGGIVLSNRHKYSTLAYQAAQGVPINELISMHKGRIIGTPDITLFLFCDDEKELRRRMERTGKTPDKFESDFEFQRKVAAKYHKLVQMAPWDEGFFGNIYPIEKPGANIFETADAIWETIEPAYKKWSARRDTWPGNI